MGRLRCAVKSALESWKRGGIRVVKVAQVNYGELLHERRVLITGGSSGIGLAIAKKCLSEGAVVVITGRDEGKLHAVAELLNNSELHVLQWDISEVDLCQTKLADAMRLAGGHFDVLVNNAGILGGHREFLDLTEEAWDQITSVNTKGLVFLTQQIVRQWIGAACEGKIINMSSMRGTLGVKDGPYGMSKWGVDGLTHGLGRTLAPYGIIVNGIAPGIIATDSINIKNVNVEQNAYLNTAPIARFGLPEEIAELAVFLMSDAANYIVGQTIVCDGGYTLKV